MIRFECDYAEGAHPKILDMLQKTNEEQTQGYGVDPYCEQASDIVKQACGREDVDVHFLVGGTQTNLTVIASILRPHEAVISAVTGHINVHETGAIEACGHRIIALPSEDGKLKADQIKAVCEEHYEDSDREHTVKPGMVFISFPTENGTIYTKQELLDLARVCKEYGLPLYLDGARLGYGLTCASNDVTLFDIACLCDVFYIGGTKIGALFGEALVIRKQAIKQDFRYIMKQKGAMLAKGRLLGIQFLTLFKDDLYFSIAQHANEQASLLRDAFMKKGYQFLYDSPTNQLFPILRLEEAEQLAKTYAFTKWMNVNEQEVAVRFCTSWMSKAEDVAQLISDIPVR